MHELGGLMSCHKKGKAKPGACLKHASDRNACHFYTPRPCAYAKGLLQKFVRPQSRPRHLHRQVLLLAGGLFSIGSDNTRRSCMQLLLRSYSTVQACLILLLVAGYPMTGGNISLCVWELVLRSFLYQKGSVHLDADAICKIRLH